MDGARQPWLPDIRCDRVLFEFGFCQVARNTASQLSGLQSVKWMQEMSLAGQERATISGRVKAFPIVTARQSQKGTERRGVIEIF